MLYRTARSEWRRHRFLAELYVRGYSWKKLFNTQGVSEEHCKRMHRDAVAKIAALNRNMDFRQIYEEEKARLDALLDQIGER